MGLFGMGGGAAPRGDFTPEKLPENRIDLFFSVVRAHWSQLIALNMLCFAAFIPLAAWMFVNLDYLLASLRGDMDWAAFMDHFLLYFAGAVPLVTVTGPVTAGLSYVMRNWARDEHAFVFSDMWSAMRANWKQALAVSFITGLFPFVTFTAVYCYGVLASTRSALMVVPMVFVCIGQLLWLLMLEPMRVMMVTYELKTRDLLKNALFLSLAQAGRSLAVRLLTALVPIAAAILTVADTSLIVYTLFAVLVYYSLFGIVLTQLSFASYANMLCDEYINPRLGEPVRRGLRPEDDTVYRPEDDEE